MVVCVRDFPCTRRPARLVKLPSFNRYCKEPTVLRSTTSTPRIGNRMTERPIKLVSDRAFAKTAPPDQENSAADEPIVSDWSVLMARAQKGDGAAYRALLREVAPYVRSLAARGLSDPTAIEDATQDVLLTIHELRHTYDPDRPFGPWIVTIARRRIIDRFRKERRRRRRETGLEPVHETFAAVSTNRADEHADHRTLREAIENLPPGQRQAIRLLKLEEKSLKEAAAVSGMTVSALKVATHRALKALKEIFEEKAND